MQKQKTIVDKNVNAILNGNLGMQIQIKAPNSTQNRRINTRRTMFFLGSMPYV
jgi:hypothetical protein